MPLTLSPEEVSIANRYREAAEPEFPQIPEALDVIHYGGEEWTRDAGEGVTRYGAADWQRQPGPRSQNRYVNKKTGQVKYFRTPPTDKGKADAKPAGKTTVSASLAPGEKLPTKKVSASSTPKSPAKKADDAYGESIAKVVGDKPKAESPFELPKAAATESPFSLPSDGDAKGKAKAESLKRIQEMQSAPIPDDVKAKAFSEPNKAKLDAAKNSLTDADLAELDGEEDTKWMTPTEKFAYRLDRAVKATGDFFGKVFSSKPAEIAGKALGMIGIGLAATIGTVVTLALDACALSSGVALYVWGAFPPLTLQLWSYILRGKDAPSALNDFS